MHTWTNITHYFHLDFFMNTLSITRLFVLAWFAETCSVPVSVPVVVQGGLQDIKSSKKTQWATQWQNLMIKHKSGSGSEVVMRVRLTVCTWSMTEALKQERTARRGGGDGEERRARREGRGGDAVTWCQRHFGTAAADLQINNRSRIISQSLMVFIQMIQTLLPVIFNMKT